MGVISKIVPAGDMCLILGSGTPGGHYYFTTVSLGCMNMGQLFEVTPVL